ncbi:MAG: enoyl-CoA hydratase/isomerase family protein [Deltaproteobacteria bacterium]|nr:enoyl-CoA hydratase/isomerase family protein [Deltaproteobacteria bacterium]
MAYEYDLIDVVVEDGVATATLDVPPANVMTLPLFGELIRLGQQVSSDAAVRVLVMKSANPDFFIAHFDVEAILLIPIEGEATRSRENTFHEMCECYRTMEKVTIAQIEQRVGGGGSEFVMAFDMRFGVRGSTVLNQMEVGLGILAGGGGTQRLPRLVGRARALEILLSADDIDAETAERWGYFNRIFEADEIGPFVERLARRIASLAPEAVVNTKRSVDCADLPLAEGLVEEAYLFEKLIRTDAARRNMRRFLEIGGQTREGELRIADLCAELARKEGRE